MVGVKYFLFLLSFSTVGSLLHVLGFLSVLPAPACKRGFGGNGAQSDSGLAHKTFFRILGETRYAREIWMCACMYCPTQSPGHQSMANKQEQQ